MKKHDIFRNENGLQIAFNEDSQRWHVVDGDGQPMGAFSKPPLKGSKPISFGSVASSQPVSQATPDFSGVEKLLGDLAAKVAGSNNDNRAFQNDLNDRLEKFGKAVGAGFNQIGNDLNQIRSVVNSRPNPQPQAAPAAPVAPVPPAHVVAPASRWGVNSKARAIAALLVFAVLSGLVYYWPAGNTATNQQQATIPAPQVSSEDKQALIDSAKNAAVEELRKELAKLSPKVTEPAPVAEPVSRPPTSGNWADWQFEHRKPIAEGNLNTYCGEVPQFVKDQPEVFQRLVMNPKHKSATDLENEIKDACLKEYLPRKEKEKQAAHEDTSVQVAQGDTDDDEEEISPRARPVNYQYGGAPSFQNMFLNYGDHNRRVGVGIGGPGRSGVGVGGRGCQPGTRPAGRLGCVGKTITDPEDLRHFGRERIVSGCVPDQLRTKWVSGTDLQGRPVRYEVKFRSRCDNRN